MEVILKVVQHYFQTISIPSQDILQIQDTMGGPLCYIISSVTQTTYNKELLVNGVKLGDEQAMRPYTLLVIRLLCLSCLHIVL